MMVSQYIYDKKYLLEGRSVARRKREWFPGAMYHIMHRGVRRKELFEEEMDYQVFLEILKSGLEKYDCILHAYCLMTNHIHLLLETTDINTLGSDPNVVRVGEWIGTVEYDYPTFHMIMRTYLCAVVSGEIELLEHEAAKWVTLSELSVIDWLPADKKLIADIACRLERIIKL